MGNTMTLEFAGDAQKLQKAAKQSTAAIESVGKSARDSAADMAKAGKEGVDYGEKIGNIGAGVTGMTDAIDSAGAAVQGLADLQQAGYQQAQKLARASFDVADAQENMRQATRDAAAAQNDGSRAALDMETALLDQKEAQDDYNEAVKEHGKSSDEAKRALLEVKSAGLDYKEAQEDANQAVRDGARAALDGKEAQLNLNDAMREANPSGLQQWADKISMITPLLTAVVGVVGLVTAAQWAWNAAQLANPIAWIILAVVALVAVIVLIATKTDWFQRAWRASWGWIKSAASNTWDFLKKIPGWLGSAFSNIARTISAPYRAAFNFIADAWNNTIGRLSWTVPGWIPGIGGYHISVPNLPKYHTGGIIPGAPGTEVPIMAMAGEEVRWPGGGSDGMTHVTVRIDSDVLVEALAAAVGRRGGNVQRVLGGLNA